MFGEINADFLDIDHKDDIATSNREKITQDDPRYIALKDFITNEVKHILNKRASLKEQVSQEETVKTFPSLRKWFDGLQGDELSAAKKLFAKVNGVTSNQGLRKSLYKSTILAFEKFRLDKSLDMLDKITEVNLETIIPILGSLESFESFAYYQITTERLAVVKKLDEMIDKDELEKVVQNHIFKNLWLLDPTWDRATTDMQMEKTLKLITDKEKEKRGRIDIRYKCPGGKHVIIELKRPGRICTKTELFDQVDNYRKAFTNQVNRTSGQSQINDSNKEIDVFVLVGNNSGFADDIDFFERNFINLITYQDLISNAYKMYSQYVDDEANHNERIKLMNSIFDSTGETLYNKEM